MSHNLLDILQSVLPECQVVSPSGGDCTLAGERLTWRLTPAGAGFWLSLQQELSDAQAARRIEDCTSWPCGAKLVRSAMGGAIGWRVEGWLKPNEGARALVSGWLERWRSWWEMNETPPSDEVIPDYWPDALVEAFGPGLEEAGPGRFRCPTRGGPALSLLGAAGELVLEVVLQRLPDDLTDAAREALDDLLLVANGRLPGLRAVREESSGGERVLRLQTWVPWTVFSAAAVRDAGSRLLAAAAELAPTCQGLTEISAWVEAYHQVLLPSGRSSPAEACPLPV